MKANKLTPEQRLEIMKRLRQGERPSALASDYGVKIHTITYYRDKIKAKAPTKRPTFTDIEVMPVPASAGASTSTPDNKVFVVVTTTGQLAQTLAALT